MKDEIKINHESGQIEWGFYEIIFVPLIEFRLGRKVSFQIDFKQTSSYRRGTKYRGILYSFSLFGIPDRQPEGPEIYSGFTWNAARICQSQKFDDGFWGATGAAVFTHPLGCSRGKTVARNRHIKLRQRKHIEQMQLPNGFDTKWIK
jgi:hypothetical protein